MKEHGQPGMPGALAQVHVTVMQLGVVQEPSMVETTHVRVVQASLEAVQVGRRQNILCNTRLNPEYSGRRLE